MSVSPEPTQNLTISADPELLTIGALAKACGVTERTLRYYEELDLIGPAKRSAGKYRLYHPRALKRVRAIASLQDLGYSLDDILAMLGPFSQSQSVDKLSRIQTSRDALLAQKEKLTLRQTVLGQLQTEVEQRLAVLDDHCAPCITAHPTIDCQESCSHRDMHLT